MPPLKVSPKDNPKLDLESYIANYDGPLRLERLITVANSPSTLSTEALRLAIVEAKKTINYNKYISLVDRLAKIVPNDPLSILDKDHVTVTSRKARAETDRLELELKQYKNNLIKESIRMGNEDLGNHYLALGDYVMATKCYTRMREYCTTPKHLAELNLKLLYVAILQSSWTNAQSFRLKMFTASSKEDDKASPHEAVLNACTGLSLLNSSQYREAAESFLNIDPIYMTMQPLASINFQRQVLSSNDIAIYGGLCALATMDSGELKTRVLENQNFRQFLELEPHLRRAINMFCSSKFSSCLSVLDSYAADYKLDLYMGNHFNELYMAIRGKSLVKWFSAFSVATLDEVQNTFPPLEDLSIEKELETMIQAGILDARIDLVDSLLISPNPDPRLNVIEETLAMAKAKQRALILRLYRINMQSSQLEVKSPSKSQNQHSEMFSNQMGMEPGGMTYGFLGGGKKKPQGGGSGSYMV